MRYGRGGLSSSIVRPVFCKTVCLCSSMGLRSVFSLSLLFVCLAFSVFNSSCLSRVGKNLEKFFRQSVLWVGGKFFLRFFPKIPCGIFPLTFNPAWIFEVARLNGSGKEEKPTRYKYTSISGFTNKGSYPLTPRGFQKWKSRSVGYSGESRYPAKGKEIKKAGKGEWTNWRQKRHCELSKY